MTASSSGDGPTFATEAPASTNPELVLGKSAQGVLVGFRVRPGAASTRLRGLYGDRLKVDVAAPPEANRANAELVRAVSRWVGVGADCVHVHSGHKSRDKMLVIAGIDETLVRERLGAIVSGG